MNFNSSTKFSDCLIGMIFEKKIFVLLTDKYMYKLTDTLL